MRITDTIPHKAGTGPYYVTEYNVASGVKMDAYDGYWRGAPAIKHVEFKVIADEAAAVIAYENGDVDYLAEVPLSDREIRFKQKRRRIRIIEG